MFVYFLLCTDGSTYIGATVDLERRLRQHNKEIKGGAHATGIKVASGKSWCRVCHVSGFPDWKSTLQFEWRWKQISRTLSKTLRPIIFIWNNILIYFLFISKKTKKTPMFWFKPFSDCFVFHQLASLSIKISWTQ